VTLDGNPWPLRVVFRDKGRDEDQGLPALKTSTPGAAIDPETEDGNDTTGECPRSSLLRLIFMWIALPLLVRREHRWH